jgi:putative chitinase
MNPEQLKKIVPTASDKLIALYSPFIDSAMKEFDINTPLRQSAFIAQIAHETGGFKWLRELWGPTSQQLKYDPPSKLSKILGNTYKGDGFKYRGRGAIQLTGRANYERFGKLLGVDLVKNPELAESQVFAFRIAGLFWKEKGLNEMADKKEFEQITRRINGGINGINERLAYYDVAKSNIV